MEKNPPVIYLLHGEDEFAIARFVADLKARLGDPSLADINTTHLDGRSSSLNDLATAAFTIPFLAPRRLVVFTHPLERFSNEPLRSKFLELLEKVPASTALALVEYKPLTDETLRRRKQVHWLEQWAQAAGDRVYLRAFSVQKNEMANWVLKRAGESGGEFTRQAAGILASLVGNEVRLADQEIQKLLVYVDYDRPVEADDVNLLTAYTGEVEIWDLVDALGNRNGQQSSRMFHRLLAEQDVLSIFGMVVRQFRLLLLAREILDGGGKENDIARGLKVPFFVAQKLVAQARRFALESLEAIYHRLLEIEVANKTGEMEAGGNLDSLIAALTT